MARKILLADDSVTAQNMGRKILADAGYEVITVNNGSAALKKIADAKPDLIVLDVYMPGYSGLEVCQRLKESGDTARIPILLTVGKLEPFKPEEAKRVRAEGFIVKPFEAGELLSALAKLEDKIVPRSDSSKPGRFARAIAAVEEGRHDNKAAVDEDSGWKNRISFPSKKKAKVPEPEDDDPAIYNPVNKDLKTVIEPPKAPATPVKAEERVDLGALAPEGLPKDVTAEEIAALAAAAAQVKGIIEVGGGPEQSDSAPADPSLKLKVEAETKSGHTEEPAPNPELKSKAPENEFKVEEGTEEQIASAFSHESSSDSAIQSAAVPEGATFAVQKSQDEPTDRETPPIGSEAENPNGSQPVSGALESPAVASLPAHDTPLQQPAHTSETEAGTVAHAAAENAQPSRWMAVATALTPEEVGVVLEDEMRKVYAAFVGADSSASHHSVSPTGSLQPTPVPAEESAVGASEPAAEPVSRTVIPETAQQAESVEPAPTSPVSAPEAASENVKELETREANSVAPPVPDATEPEHGEPTAPEQISAPPLVEEPVAARQTSEESTAPQTEAAADSAPEHEEQVASLSAVAENASESQVESASQSEVVEPSAVASSVETPDPQAIPEELKAPEVPADEVVAASASASEAPVPATEPMGSPEAPRVVTSDMAKRESDIAATTAAAWASWRRIRESGDPKSESDSSAAPANLETKEAPAAKDEAAMAVAAGAERAPEEVSESSEDSPEIATIVDTVLADLRPKIVEEISRKLGKKNKKK